MALSEPMRVQLIAAVLVAGLISPAGAANVAKTYSYFPVGGSTLDAIQTQLDTRGPEVEPTGRRHPGAVWMNFVADVDYRTSSKGCSIASASLTVQAKIILPRWRGPLPTDPALQLFWDTLSADIKRHEEAHVIIAKNHARALERSLLAVGGQWDCDDAEAKFEETTRQGLAKHYAAQTEFDCVERLNFDSRMERLLQHRRERISKAQR